jgi:hypothetical protein
MVVTNSLYDSWVKDLTEEGIEPNPGPSKPNGSSGESSYFEEPEQVPCSVTTKVTETKTNFPRPKESSKPRSTTSYPKGVLPPNLAQRRDGRVGFVIPSKSTKTDAVAPRRIEIQSPEASISKVKRNKPKTKPKPKSKGKKPNPGRQQLEPRRQYKNSELIKRGGTAPIMRKPPGVSSGVYKLLRMLMLPYEMGREAIGWPRSYEDAGTHPESIQIKVEVPWDAGDSDVPAQLIDRDHAFMLVFRSMLCHYILYAVNGAKRKWAYLFHSYSQGINDSKYLGEAYIDWQPTPWVYGTPTGTTIDMESTSWSPHGSFFFPGKTKDFPNHRFFWMGKSGNPSNLNEGDYLTVGVKNNDGSITMNVGARLLMFTQNERYSFYELGSTELLAGGATATYSVAANTFAQAYLYGAYCALEIFATCVDDGIFVPDTSGYTVTMQLDSNKSGQPVSPVFTHNHHPTIKTLIHSLKKHCINGLSAWYQNFAAGQYANGDIPVQQVIATKGWGEILIDENAFQNDPRTQMWKAAKGDYSYEKPCNISSFDLVSEMVNDGTYVKDCAWNIDGDQDYLCLYPQIPQLETGGVAQSAVLRISSSFELVSDDPLFPPIRNTISSLDAQLALDLMRSQPQHFENENHLKKITGFLNKLRGGVQTGLKYAGPILDALAVLA